MDEVTKNFNSLKKHYGLNEALQYLFSTIEKQKKELFSITVELAETLRYTVSLEQKLGDSVSEQRKLKGEESQAV